MINKKINQLIIYGLEHNLLKEDDKYYAVNRILTILNLKKFNWEEIESTNFSEIIQGIIDFALKNKIITHDSITERDAFEARIVDCLIPRPSELNKIFRNYYKKAPRYATDFLHKFSIDTNYIKVNRIKKNIQYKYQGKYADLILAINLSKPEKDPMDIKKQNQDNSKYPICPLCMENVGSYQTPSLAPRSNHRVVSISLDNEKDAWGIQYSPYAYFNEHMIVLRKEHSDMYVNEKTFSELIDFINKFPHYLIGSNAGLPIVGGSILSHHHFQGGRFDFPIESARVIKKYKKNRVNIEVLDWPMATIRFSGNNENRILDMVNQVYQYWQTYTNEEIMVFAKTNEEHNTVTPIVKLNGSNYNFYMILRNNYTTKEFPYGLFHTKPERFHIKKENIGLIEVMGMAILPGRLMEELELIKDVLNQEKKISDDDLLLKHSKWIEELQSKNINEDIDIYLRDDIGRIFENMLEDANVFKFGDINNFLDFVEKAIY
ncbi:MAG: galactose-1-phosphate uridylyltransferase [Candidatus Izimaplasma sp.]|nr:galactose-1-phosphate uridylyltransferase [Candidatus Izimaplasma bacterium]